MELVYYVITAWLVVTYLITSIQKEEVLRSIIVYCIYIILTGSIFSVLGLNLNFIQLPDDKTKFLSFLIFRDITMPFLTLVFVNSFYRLKAYKKILPFILLVLVFFIFDFINLKLQIYSYIKWSSVLALLFNTLHALIALIIGRCVDIIKLRGGSEYK
jgi:hypothetical protein